MFLAAYNRKPDWKLSNIGDWDTDEEAIVLIHIRDDEGQDQHVK